MRRTTCRSHVLALGLGLLAAAAAARNAWGATGFEESPLFVQQMKLLHSAHGKPIDSGGAMKITFPKKGWPLVTTMIAPVLDRDIPHATDPAALGRFPLCKLSFGDEKAGPFRLEDASAFASVWSNEKVPVTMTVLHGWPGILVESEASRLGIRPATDAEGTAFPNHAAFQTGGGVEILKNPGSLARPSMSANWLLLFRGGGPQGHGIGPKAYGGKYRTRIPLDCPLLLILQKHPAEIALGREGLALRFAGGAESCVILPLYGVARVLEGAHPAGFSARGSLLQKSEWKNALSAAGWEKGLPDGVVERCRRLSRIFRSVPVGVAESYAFDAKADVLRIREAFTFKTITDEWRTSPERLAPLPPFLGHVFDMPPGREARDAKTVSVTGRVIRLDYAGAAGPLAGVKDTGSYEITIRHISRYLFEDRAAAKVGTGRAAGLRRRLAEEVEKMIAAGHLNPEFFVSGIHDYHYTNRAPGWGVDLWHNPAELVTILVEALPHLPADLRKRLEPYIQDEFKNFPPYQVGHIGYRDGKRRGYFPYTPEMKRGITEEWGKGPGAPRWGGRKTSPIYAYPHQNIYAMSLYAREFGGAKELFARCKPPLLPENPDHWAYGIIASSEAYPTVLEAITTGLVGYARLAKMADADPETLSLAVYKAGRALLARAGTAAFGETVALWRARRPDEAALYVPYIYNPERVIAMAEILTYAFPLRFMCLCPQTARFLADNCRARVGRSIAAYMKKTPYWFVAGVDDSSDEGVIKPPYEPHCCFQAKALVLGAGGTELEKFLDVPIVPVGDLFYIHNLTRTIEACRGGG